VHCIVASLLAAHTHPCRSSLHTVLPTYRVTLTYNLHHEVVSPEGAAVPSPNLSRVNLKDRTAFSQSLQVALESKE
jgi:hypothetical protein